MASRVVFRRDGYIVLENAFGDDQLARLRAAAECIVDRFDADAHRTVFSTVDRDTANDDYFLDSAEAVHCFLEEGAVDAQGRLTRPKARAINKIGHALHDLDPAFGAFCRQPLLGRVLRELGHDQPVLVQTMVIFKQPGIGGEVGWHQDATYLDAGPPGVIGAWVALEDADRDNGCLWVAPGGHLGPLRETHEVDWERRCGRLRSLDPSPWPTTEQARALEVPAGTLVLFSDHLPHYSAVNRSDRSRMAFTMHFANRGAAWRDSNWLQRPQLGDFAV
ncbi:phytanoyl-CoA dioxygenase family protein [Marinihelvus fidelis]|uniref:Phytanoyl-CoA dioxygenase family protein n=1 Tax=Marinihelvus fidelis TaxID=2613842 RepID=A0A5N0T6T5_9GAMM|nr:phytanoyl-CoA dioxygenase family protein [Marinihelvus fidelis]